jgi:hypothetical protein
VDEKFEYGKFDFTLQLDTEDAISKNGQSVVKRPRRVRFLSDRLPKGCGKRLVLSKIPLDSIPSVRGIAQQTGMSPGYVSKVLKCRKETEKETPRKHPQTRRKHFRKH